MRGTGKDHGRMNLDIWGDDDFLDVSPLAQHLYFVLWFSPGLSYCGAGDWHPGRISAKANGWTAFDVQAAAAELSRAAGHFLLIDDTTDEFLLRSWIKHDGLWKQPNMAVSMANARADLASRTLRGVVVHEVSKIKRREPGSASWKRNAVAQMLTQTAIDPDTVDRYTPFANTPVDPQPDPYADSPVDPTEPTNRGVGVDPPSTPAPAISPLTPSPCGGSVSTEGHQGSGPNHEPPLRCPKHKNDADPPACGPCKSARLAHEAWQRGQAENELAHRRSRRAAIDACTLCDDEGWIPGTEPVIRCNHRPMRRTS